MKGRSVKSNLRDGMSTAAFAHTEVATRTDAVQSAYAKYTLRSAYVYSTTLSSTVSDSHV